jgi:putative DNA methylase
MSEERKPLGWHSRGYFPHFDGGEVAQAIMFRLGDSLAKEILQRWENELVTMPEARADAERRKKIEAALDAGAGRCWLRDPKVARIVEGALLRFDGERYSLHSWVVMPNHVHVLITALEGHSLSDIVQSWKSFTAKAANRLLGRTETFWRRDYFDRFIRNQKHFAAALDYIESNPVKAGLCARREDWEFGSARRREGIAPGYAGLRPAGR